MAKYKVPSYKNNDLDKYIFTWEQGGLYDSVKTKANQYFEKVDPKADWLYYIILFAEMAFHIFSFY